jgi:chitinase
MGMKKTLLFRVLLLQMTAFSQQKNYKVIAYYTGNGETIKQYPVKELTHIIYSFLKLQNDTLTFANDDQRHIVEQLVDLKKENPSLKIMVSLGGWGGCAPCSELFSSVAHRNTFAKTTVALFEKYHIDGLDLDWEYPAIEGYPDHKYDTADKANFTALIIALRKEMGSKYLLSFAAGGFDKFLENSVDWDAIMPQLDFVNLMTYDLVSGYSKVTGHHTPLAGYMPGQQSTKNCVDWLLKHKVAADKLIIGAAFYARVWAQVEAGSNNGLYKSGVFLQGVNYKEFSTYFGTGTGFTYYWDDKAKAPWQYNKAKKLFATFDDEKSIGAKTNFIRKNKLGGIMFWELSLDKGSNGLVAAIKKGLGK